MACEDFQTQVEEFKETSKAWLDDSDWLESRDQRFSAGTQWLANFLTETEGLSLGRVFAQDYNKLLNSNSPVANFLAANIFRSPHSVGRTGWNSATGKENYTSAIMTPLENYNKVFQRFTLEQGGSTPSGHAARLGFADGMQAKFNREIRLEIEARRRGATDTNASAPVKEAADMFIEANNRALNIAKGNPADGELSVHGFDDIVEQPYVSHRWSGAKVHRFIKDGVLDRADVEAGFKQGLKDTGIEEGAADALVKSMVARLVSHGEGVSFNLQNLYTADGRFHLNNILEEAGIPEQQRRDLLSHIDEARDAETVSNRAKERLDFNLEQPIRTKDGSTLQLVDLLTDDLIGSQTSYAREIAGAAALARKGVRSRAQRESVIQAIQEEQRDLGETVTDANLLRAMFTEFDGGASHGYDPISGKTNDGVGPAFGFLKLASSLALFGQLGLTQLGEVGVSVATVGLKNWARRGVLNQLSAGGREKNQQLLDELAVLTGNIGKDHHHFQPHLNLDEVSPQDVKDFFSSAQRLTGKLVNINNWLNAFNTVRSYQQKTAALAIADRVVMRIAKGNLSQKQMDRIKFDFGLTDKDITHIKSALDDGTIKINEGGYVDELNMDQWDYEARMNFAGGVTGSVSDQVQKSLAGESDAWMRTGMGQFLTDLRTFPLQAITKQASKQLLFMDTETLASVTFGMASAYGALTIKDAINGTERKDGERERLAIMYSPHLGFIPQFYDPLTSIMGLHDYKINPYGSHYEYTSPTLDSINRLAKAPGALVNYAMGDDTAADRSAIRALPFLNMYGFRRLMDPDE